MILPLDRVRKSVQRLLAPLTEAFYLLVGLFASARRGIAARALRCFEPQRQRTKIQASFWRDSLWLNIRRNLQKHDRTYGKFTALRKTRLSFGDSLTENGVRA